MRKSNICKLGPVFLLLAAFFAVAMTAQTPRRRPGLENELIVRPSPTPTPEPRGTVFADPALMDPELIPPDTEPFPPSAFAYYIHVTGIVRVLVSDDRGHTDNLSKLGLFIPTVPDVSFLGLCEHSCDVILPVDKTYTLTLQSDNRLVALEVLKGQGDTSPVEAMRYLDLNLGAKKARLEITPRGLKPLRVETGPGRFDSVIEPTAWLHGEAAKDTHGPLITFRVLKRHAKSLLIAIEAKDRETAVKSLTYTYDGRNLFSYKGPFRLSPSQATGLFAWADDYYGNRYTTVFDQTHSNFRHPR